MDGDKELDDEYNSILKKFRQCEKEKKDGGSNSHNNGKEKKNNTAKVENVKDQKPAKEKLNESSHHENGRSKHHSVNKTFHDLSRRK